jgi:ArsR family transcriptional regulator, arsenate/arsenite/antimonite-responsive transcriptional repressor
MKAIERHAGQLAALGHVARISIVRAVVEASPDGVTTTEVPQRLGIPWTTLNHHLDRVVEVGLVTVRKDGKAVFHTADCRALRALADFLHDDVVKSGLLKR